MKTLDNLKPALIWSYFLEITRIPRPSGKTQAIQDWLLHFAKKHALEYTKDAVGNVIIRKAATKGMEHLESVVLQSHMDMVCEKNSGVQHDFEKDPIDVYIDGEWLKAKGTTLGADNGIGMAAQLAVLASDDVEHGPLECLFTVDEEVGLVGAFNIQAGFMRSKRLLNLDSEDEGMLFIGCAGGINTKAYFEFEKEKAKEKLFFFQLSVSGLKGGHSGCDIHEGRGNANQLLSRFLWQESRLNELYLVDFKGGNLSNAIPREASCIAAVPLAQKEEVSARVNIFEAELQNEFSSMEPGLKFTIESHDAVGEVLKKADSERFIQAMYACPNGVIAMSKEIEGLVETSTNLASVKPLTENSWLITSSQRSSIESSNKDISHRVEAIFRLAGMKVEHNEGYPGWKPNPDSELVKIMLKTHKEVLGYEPVLTAIHAGLECGLFLQKYPDLDMVSFGPTMTGVHSPDEKLNIPTVENFWNWLVRSLKQM
ncbi:MAG: aminoacyl-histidine dipeptidase [Bacteroidales bacterium]|nr:aminoacyl-histidine dipeptidase [Bacteroidales bacterium]MDD3431855.1 aminoacyl-histidine dipeptidase [Bacteroidales bacterium]MDD4362231.1 aminoacyl-histidine dipeptidase [Bacteroidales bacterium]MDD4430767.1 aminoacyl-histidine dipeptidase [Bacteroidales bacterium]